MSQGPLGITGAKCFISLEATMRRAGWLGHSRGRDRLPRRGSQPVLRTTGTQVRRCEWKAEFLRGCMD